MTRSPGKFRFAPAALAAAMGVGSLIGAVPHAHAGPAGTIYTPIVDYREWELELKAGVQDWGNRDEGERASKIAIGYGLAPRWGVEFEAEYSQVPGHVGHIEEYEFENIFQLTEHGEHWLDMGIFAELEHNRLENVNTAVLGPMFQTETTHTQTNLNIYLERRLSALADGAGADEGEGGSRNELVFQAQWKYNLHPQFQPGLQAFGSLGDPAHLHSQELKLGPAFFGVANLGNGKKLKYNAALLGGLTRETPNTTVRMQLEYEFF
ncbi:MAG: hypothetical protein ACTHMO_03275 [Rhodanobacteraceae bacterium]